MITINSDANTPQPTKVTEELVQIQTDQIAINGTMTRNRMGQKDQATCEWDWLTPSQYQLLIGYFTSGNTVTYTNTQSDYSGGTLTFSGFPVIKEGEYIQGGSLYRKISVVIRQN